MRNNLRALGALFCLALALGIAGNAIAQDPKATAAQEAAREWLKMTDRDDSNASWQAAGKQFQAALNASTWAAELHRQRQPLGAVITRTIISTRFQQNLPGLARRRLRAGALQDQLRRKG